MPLQGDPGVKSSAAGKLLFKWSANIDFLRTACEYAWASAKSWLKKQISSKSALTFEDDVTNERLN
jgi:hypothetical protein